jgi:hypothetical protein
MRGAKPTIAPCYCHSPQPAAQVNLRRLQNSRSVIFGRVIRLLSGASRLSLVGRAGVSIHLLEGVITNRHVCPLQS